MFLDSDTENFVHISRVDDGFIIIQRNLEFDGEPTNSWFMCRSDFSHSKAYTDLNSARELCHTLLGLLGVNLMKDQLRLAIEIISEKVEEPKTKGARVKN